VKTRNHKLLTFAPALFLACGLFPARLAAGDRGFDAVVHAVSTTYHARQSLKFISWFAGMATKFARPEGVKSLRMAIFEDQDFTPRGDEEVFARAVDSALQKDWQPLVRMRSKRAQERTFIYARDAGKDVKLFLVSLESSEAVVMEVKMSARRFSQMINEPENMSASLRDRNSRTNSASDEAALKPPPLRHREDAGAQ
jgi:hypothetical protein